MKRRRRTKRLEKTTATTSTDDDAFDDDDDHARTTRARTRTLVFSVWRFTAEQRADDDARVVLGETRPRR
jgi:hypothetical protein